MDSLEKIISEEPKYRKKQIYTAFFDPRLNSFEEVSTLPKDLRQKLSVLPWLPVELVVLQESKIDDSKKALLVLADGQRIETVLMGRESKKSTRPSERRYTVCLSSQVGCPMGCAFCATGALGWQRNLTAEEIIGQYRFWQRFLYKKNASNKIDNIVFMGQGEPLLNYQEVKTAVNLILQHTDVGPTKITLSTVGVEAGMKQILTDDDFPPVRFALSLHNAVVEERKKMIPSQSNYFFDFFVKWAKDYRKKFPSRTHFIGLEYVFIADWNDSQKHLKALISLASRLGKVRINLIPLNSINEKMRSSETEKMKEWQKKLMAAGFVVTIRLSQGVDISAACGQLKNSYGNK